MRNTLLLPLVLLALTQTGCVLYAPEIAQTKHTFEAEYPEAHFEKETLLNLGPVSLWMARGILHLTDPDEYAHLRPYLHSLRRLKVGIYRTEDLQIADDVLKLDALSFLHEERWKMAVRLKRPDQHVWVFYRPRRRAHPPRDLFVIALDEEELMVLHMRGQLDRIVQHALTEENVLTEGSVLHDLLGRRHEEAPPEEPAPAKDTTRAVPAW